MTCFLSRVRGIEYNKIDASEGRGRGLKERMESREIAGDISHDGFGGYVFLFNNLLWNRFQKLIMDVISNILDVKTESI